jgi:hypothetical protein
MLLSPALMSSVSCFYWSNGSQHDSSTRDGIIISGDKIMHCEFYMSLCKLANCMSKIIHVSVLYMTLFAKLPVHTAVKFVSSWTNWTATNRLANPDKY